MSGKKLDDVSTCSSAMPANEKLVGERLKMVGIASFHAPVAFAKGVSVLNANAGTRGMVKARTIPMLFNR